MITTIARHEWRTLLRSRHGQIALILLGLVSLYALSTGWAWQASRSADIEALTAEAEQALADARADTDGPFAGAVTGVQGDAVLPPGRLAPLTIGVGDLLPYRAEASVWRRIDTIFIRYQLESPLSLLAGRFDLAFVIVFLLPLAIIALSYDLISGERELGTLALVLAQPVRLRTLLLAKVAARLALIAAFLASIGFLAWAVVFGFDSDVVPRLVVWLSCALVYAGFWLALAVAVASWRVGSATHAMVLAVAWLLFVLVLPSGLDAGVQAVQPMPSRLEQLSAMRQASSEAAKESASLLAAYYHEHPELASGGQQGGFMPAYFASQREVERRLQPIVVGFDQSLEAQQGLVGRFGLLSPAIVAHRTLALLAGQDAARYRRFADQSRHFLDVWNAALSPRIFRGETLAGDDYDGLPTFTFEEISRADMLRGVASGFAALFAAIALAVGTAAWRLRRFRLAE